VRQACFLLPHPRQPLGSHLNPLLQWSDTRDEPPTDGGVINVNQLALPFTDPAISLLLFSNSAVGYTEFAADLRAYATAVAPVPAPATLPLFATGLGLMALFARRKKRTTHTTSAAATGS
jgi:hypothetical protein